MASEHKDKQPPKQPRDVRAVKLVEELLEKHDIDLFIDVTIQPRILIAQDHPETNWSLEDSRVRDWLADKFYDSENELLTHHEIDRVLTVIRGKARKQKECRIAHDQRLLEILEKYPVLEIVAEFIASKGHRKKSGEDFYRDLKRFAKEQGFLTGNGKHFPGSANRLTRILNLYVCTQALQQLGIRYSSANRDSSGRRLLDFQKIAEDTPGLSSGQPSASNPGISNTLKPAVNTESTEKAARLERLRSRRLRSSHDTSAEGVSNGEAMEANEPSILGPKPMGPNSWQPPSEKAVSEPGEDVPNQSP